MTWPRVLVCLKPKRAKVNTTLGKVPGIRIESLTDSAATTTMETTTTTTTIDTELKIDTMIRITIHTTTMSDTVTTGVIPAVDIATGLTEDNSMKTIDFEQILVVL